MKNHELIFQLNDKEKIIIQTSDPLEEIHCCYEAPIIFFDGIHSIVCGEDVADAMRELRDHLQKALQGELKLHRSIVQDLGYLASEELQDRANLVYRKVGDVERWVGWDYYLWGIGGDNRANVWLYNDADGAIVFKITPGYPWLFESNSSDPQYVPYEEWIKTYKPLVVRHIPVAVAREWLAQAEFLVKKIDENIARIFSKDRQES